MNWLFQHRRAILLLSLLIGMAIYAVLLPWLSFQWADRSSSKVMIELESFNLIHTIYERLVDLLFMAVFFFIGANIGSFLNVVAYRMPQGISVVTRRSRCPACNTGLGPRDNIPVFGWLMLGGACRYCGSRISPRYPIVEGILASLFFLFFWRELISGGANLPIRSPNTFSGVVWILLYTKWDLVAIYSYHMLLFTLLLTWSLFAWDDHRVPRIALINGLILLLIPPLMLNYLVQVPVNHWQAFSREYHSFPLENAMTIGWGGMVGWGVAILFCPFWKWLGWRDDSIELSSLTTSKSVYRQLIPILQLKPAGAISLVCIGVALGWQAVMLIAVVATILYLVAATVGRLIQRKEPQQRRAKSLAAWPACLLLTTVIHHFYWRTIFAVYAGQPY